MDGGLKKMQKTALVGLGAITTGLAGIGTTAVLTGQKFETSFAKVSTMFGGVDVDVKGLKNQILDLSTATGIASDELNEGLYSALSAGVPVTEDMTEAIDFLTTSTKLAKGGFTTTEKAVDVVTTVLNGYKMETKDATKVADLLLQTQNKGKTTVDELASSIAQVTPTASAMGVSFEQVTAVLATMTAQGTPTSMAVTQLNQLINELGKEGQTANKNMMEMYESMGYGKKSFTELMQEGVGLNDIIADMEAYAKENGKSLIDMFGSVESGKAALSMAGDSAITYAKNLDAMYQSQGLTQKASDTMNDTFETQASRLKQVVSSKLIEFYNGLQEPLKKVTKMSADFISNMDVDSVINGLGVLIGVLGGVFAILTSMRGAIALFNIITTVQQLGGLNVMLMNLSSNIGVVIATIAPVVGIIAGIIAIITAVTLAIKQLWETNEGFRNVVMTAIKGITDTLNNAYNTIIKPVLDNLVKILLDVWNNGIKPLWDNWVAFVGAIISRMADLWNNIKPIVDWFISVFGPVLSNIINSVANAFGSAIRTIINVAGSWLKNITSVVDGIIRILNGIITFIKGVFTGNWKMAWQGVVDIFGGIFSTLGGLVSAPINAVIGLINGAIGAINSISVDIPKWVPVFGGKHFGLSIPRIPYLEKGGVLKKGQVGLLEGNGAEAVVPLEKNKAWIRAVTKDFVRFMPQVQKGNTTQVNNFYQKVETPDEYAKAMRLQNKYGLAGV